jgi:alpha-methylacyl-CoA racemase
VNGVEQHAPAPRFSRTSQGPVRAPRRAGADTVDVLREAGFSGEDVERLRAAGGLS